jgi:ABC-type uncharacterized transport system permease subunit
MPHLSGWLFLAAAALYVAGIGFSLWVLVTRRQEGVSCVPRCALVGLVLHFAGILARAFEREGLPFVTLREVLFLLAFAGISVYLFAHFRYRLEIIGVIILPLVVALMTITVLVPDEPSGVSAGWRMSLRAIHIVPAILGVGFLFLTFATSVVYLVQERGLKAHRPLILSAALPSLERCDRITYLSLGWGFAFLTLVVVTGALTNRYMQGGFSWVLRERWALLAWLLFAVVIYDRVFAGRWRGRLSAYLSIIGFVVIIMRMVGVGS